MTQESCRPWGAPRGLPREIRGGTGLPHVWPGGSHRTLASGPVWDMGCKPGPSAPWQPLLEHPGISDPAAEVTRLKFSLEPGCLHTEAFTTAPLPRDRGCVLRGPLGSQSRALSLPGGSCLTRASHFRLKQPPGPCRRGLAADRVGLPSAPCTARAAGSRKVCPQPAGPLTVALDLAEACRVGGGGDGTTLLAALGPETRGGGATWRSQVRGPLYPLELSPVAAQDSWAVSMVLTEKGIQREKGL